MSIVSNNIKYLRRLNGLTQEQFARKIAIKRSLLGAYEEARANPNLTNLKNMAAAFGISVDNLLKNDLRRLRETPEMALPLNRPMTVSHSGGMPSVEHTPTPTFTEPQPLSKIMEAYQQQEPPIRTVARQVNLKPVSGETTPAVPAVAQRTAYAKPPEQPSYQPAQPAYQPAQPEFPTFNNQFQTQPVQQQVPTPAVQYQPVQWIAADRQQEYLANFQNPAFLTALPVFQLPNLPSGYYRAFECEDFTYPNALLIGTFVRNWYDVMDGAGYVFVLRNQGFMYRYANNQVKTTGYMLLTSSTGDGADQQVALQEILEVWEVQAFVSMQMPAPVPSLEKVARLVGELQAELDQLGFSAGN